MGFVYILKSENSGRFYVGSTDDVPRRLAEHERGKNLATRNRKRWKPAKMIQGLIRSVEG